MAFTLTARHSDPPNSGSAESSGVTSSATPTASSLLLYFGALEEDDFTGGPGNGVADTLGTPTGGSLTYTLAAKVDGSTTPAAQVFSGTDGYWINAGLWRAPVPASPPTHTITLTATDSGWWCGASIDVTGHNTTTPVVQTKTASATEGGGDSESASITLDSTPTEGNLIVVCVAVGSDGGGTITTPTGYTATVSQTGAYSHVAMFTKTAGSSESATITVGPTLGTTVGNSAIVAVEIAAAGGTSATATPTAVAGTAAVATPTVTAGATVTTTAVAGTTAVATPTVSTATNATATPTAVAGAASVGTPTLSVGSTVTPTVVAGTTTAPTPTVSASNIMVRATLVALGGNSWSYSDPAALV